MYCTPAHLLAEYGAKELSQVATPDGAPLVALDLVRAVCNGTSTSEYTAHEIAVANGLLETINGKCIGASDDIDGYLLMVGPVPVSAATGTLKSWAMKIARYKLHGHLRISSGIDADGQHPIHRDYDQVIKLLESVAARKMTIGAGDPNPPQLSAESGFESTELNFSRKAREGGAL